MVVVKAKERKEEFHRGRDSKSQAERVRSSGGGGGANEPRRGREEGMKGKGQERKERFQGWRGLVGTS